LCCVLLLFAVENAACDLLVAARVGNTVLCDPSSVPPAQRCSYVEQHKELCYPEGGVSAYLEIHYCKFSPSWCVPAAGVVMMVTILLQLMTC